MAEILVVDDDVAFCMMVKNLLERNAFSVETSFSSLGVPELLRKRKVDLVLTDMRMPDGSGLDLLRQVKKDYPDMLFVMMTRYADIATAIQSIKEGAYNYISKPFQPEEILSVLKEALASGTKEHSRVSLNQEGVVHADFYEGQSPLARELIRHVMLVAPTSMSVLITGESGTGKEYVARLIHASSKRKGMPFVAVDCGAIPKDLVVSEFFGHVKGAFTGALTDKNGYFVQAQGGTLFLDEVGNLSYDSQIQLLRAIQERVIQPVGASVQTAIDVRIVAATNEDLKQAMDQGDFREDLYHRFNEFQIAMPALRDRKEDVMLFAGHFLKQANCELNRQVLRFDPEVEAVFLRYGWPGNIREMRNMVKRAVLLSDDNTISLGELPPEISFDDNISNRRDLFNAENEIGLIKEALKMSGYNKSKAARILKIDRKTLYNKIKNYDIDVPRK